MVLFYFYKESTVIPLNGIIHEKAIMMSTISTKQWSIARFFYVSWNMLCCNSWESYTHFFLWQCKPLERKIFDRDHILPQWTHLSWSRMHFERHFPLCHYIHVVGKEWSSVLPRLLVMLVITSATQPER